MKFRKIYLLYVITLIPSILMVGFILGIIRDIATINQLKAIVPEKIKLFSESTSLLINHLLLTYIYFDCLLLVVSSTILILRLSRTTSDWVKLYMHILLSFFLGGLLFVLSGAVAMVIGLLFNWRVF
jgi:hypothetical protein